MKIKILRGFCLRKGLDVFPGDVVEATKFEAAKAIQLSRAVVYVEPEESESQEQYAVSAEQKAVAEQQPLVAKTPRFGKRGVR